MVDGGVLSGPFMANLAKGLGQGLTGGGSSATANGTNYAPLDGSNWTVNFKSPGASGASVAGPLGLSPGSTGSGLVWAGIVGLVAFAVLARRKGGK